MSEERPGNGEIRRMRRLLREMEKIAKESSLTGAFEKGARSCGQQFNGILAHLERTGAVPAGIFSPLGEDATFDEVGVAAALLAGSLDEEEDVEAGRGRRGRRGGPEFGNGNVISITGLGGLAELKELKELGRVIRDRMPEWFKGEGTVETEEQAAGEGAAPNGLTEIESRLAEVGAKLQAVAEQLRRGDLGDEPRAELAEQLSRLGQEQARLARRHAMLRERAAASG
jgi:hypothetical protein